MTLYCLQGVGILTERSYIMKLSDLNESCALPFRIDGTVSGKNEGCLKSGAQVRASGFGFNPGDLNGRLRGFGLGALKDGVSEVFGSQKGKFAGNVSHPSGP